ncbi:MAG: LysE family transporter [Bacteroidetes bacterium]|nr:LysE family transporter [Bacteroidota bacterium]
MLLSLLIGAIVGFVLAVAPGPVGVTVLKAGLRGDRRGGALISLGASVLDFIYSLLAMLTASIFFSSLQSLFINHPIVMLIFQVVCGGSMIIYGVFQFRNTKPDKDFSDSTTSTLRLLISNLQKNGPFLFGVGIALANVANPTFLPSLTSTVLLVQHYSLVETTLIGSVMYSIGFGIGNFGWLYSLLRVVIHYKERFSPAFTQTIHRFAGATMIGAGALLGYRVLLFTKWTELLRVVLAI